MQSRHRSVLLDEVVHAFAESELKVFFEGTVGAGGHARAILEAHPEIERYVACDRDPRALELAKGVLEPWWKKVEWVRGSYAEEIQKVVEDGVTDEELARAKGSLRGSLALAMEDPNSRMVRLGRDELAGAPHLSVDERIAKLDAVTTADVLEVCRTLLTGPKVIGAVGPFASDSLDRWVA